MINRNKIIFEKILKAALEKNIDEMIAQYPSPEELKDKYTFLPEFEKRIDEIIHKKEAIIGLLKKNRI